MIVLHLLMLFRFATLTIDAANYFNFVPSDVFFEFYPNGDLNNLQEIHMFNNPGNNIQIPDSFDATKPTYIYIHGFFTFANLQREQTKMFYENIGNECCNLLLLNWINGANNVVYWHVRKRTEEVKHIKHIRLREYVCVAVCEHVPATYAVFVSINAKANSKNKRQETKLPGFERFYQFCGVWPFYYN